MRATDVAPGQPGPAERAGRARRVLAAVLVALAVVGLVGSVVGVWANRLLLDSDRFARTATDTITHPVVATAIGDHLADQSVTLAEELLDLDRVPRVVRPYADLLAVGLRNTLAREIADLVESERARAALTTGLRSAHRVFLHVLEGDGDEVTLNLLPVLGRALRAVEERGLLPSGIDVPELERGGDPAEQRAELEAALGVTLADDFGELTVYEGDEVDDASSIVVAARYGLSVFRRALAGLVAVTLVLGVAALAVSTRRRRTVLQLAAGAAVAMLVAGVIVGRIQQQLPQLVVEENREAAREIVSGFVAGLVGLTRLLALIGAVVVVGLVAWERVRRQPAVEPSGGSISPAT